MNTQCKIACLSLLSVMAACAPAGYYDSNGDYRSYGQSDSFRHEHALAGTPDANTYSEDRSGYYDRDGNYVTEDSGVHIPRDYLPPRGMCRVWFAGRTLENQPAVESCNGIKNRVPEGAYVIYGK
jgi:hypothetical protein